MTALEAAVSGFAPRLAGMVRLIGALGAAGEGPRGLEVHPPWSPCCAPPCAGYPGDCSAVMLAELHEIECCRTGARG